MSNEEQVILAAAKEVARTEQKMYEKEFEYQEAYDNFKRAQQALHDAQTIWFKTEAGLLSPMQPEGSSPDVLDASTGA